MIAAALWTMTAVLILSGIVCAFAFGEGGGHGLAPAFTLLSTGLATSAAAATMTIRNMIHRQNLMLRDAFALGQDASKLRRVGS